MKNWHDGKIESSPLPRQGAEHSKQTAVHCVAADFSRVTGMWLTNVSVVGSLSTVF
jgi:hypothetical protein